MSQIWVLTTVESPKAPMCHIDLPLTWDRIPPPMKMMKLMNYIPGLGLGKHHQGTHKIIEVKEQTARRGLGYVPTPKDVAEDRKAAHGKCPVTNKRGSYTTSDLRPYSFDMARYFTKKTSDLYEDTEKMTELINAKQALQETGLYMADFNRRI